MKKAMFGFTADTLQKIGIAGIALGIFQGKLSAIWVGAAFIPAGYAFKYLEQTK